MNKALEEVLQDEPKIKIVFLDIDGVLNSQLFYEKQHQKKLNGEELEPYPYNHIDPQAIEFLNGLADDCKFVLSSTWRNSSADVFQILKDKGFRGEFIGKTGNGCRCCLRGNEIRAWLEDNSFLLGGVYYGDFKDYVIIDDDSDMLYWQREHLFLTDFYCGITPKIVYKIRRFLGLSTKGNL